VSATINKRRGELDLAPKEIYLGIIRLYVLHHAGKRAISGSEMSWRLFRRGFKFSPRFIHPILRSLERKGYLMSRQVNNGGQVEKTYTATRAGRLAVERAREKVRAAAELLATG
jgi:PadR family transcriptional regulator, regulatory protein PadR